MSANKPASILLLATDDALRQSLQSSLDATAYYLDDAINPARDALAQVAELQPALIIIGTESIPAWMPDVRSSPATRRIPVLAVGEDADAAHYAGIKDVLSATDFMAALPDAVSERVRIFRHAEALADQCDESPSAEVLKGLHEFNAHDYYECHETLEHAWMMETGPVRELYRAILQVGIAYYQIERGNYQGALKMFLRTIQWFGPLPDHCQGIDVAGLRTDAIAARVHLESLGPEGIADFDRSYLKPIRFDEDAALG